MKLGPSLGLSLQDCSSFDKNSMKKIMNTKVKMFTVSLSQLHVTVCDCA